MLNFFKNRLDIIRVLFRSVDIIMGTFKIDSARLFWQMIARIHIESHPVTCWKFFYVFHRLIRDSSKHVRSTIYSIMKIVMSFC